MKESFTFARIKCERQELILKKKNIFIFQNTNGDNRYLENIEFCQL